MLLKPLFEQLSEKLIATSISTSLKFVWLKQLLRKYICLSSYPRNETLQFSAPCVINLLYLNLVFYCMQLSFKSEKDGGQRFAANVSNMP